MEAIRVCIYDKEEPFAKSLAALLNRYGEGKYKVIAFTDQKLLKEHMQQRTFHIFISSDMQLIREVKQQMPQIYLLWLREKEDEELPEIRKNISTWNMISKYAGAKKICHVVEQTTSKLVCAVGVERPVVAIYSPVGRCGKTEFALSLASKGAKREWLYIGLEDYGAVLNQDVVLQSYEWEDEFLYHIKERDEEKLKDLIERCQGVIPSLFSPFDGKQLNREDWAWIVDVMQKQTCYWGTIFDIGTGILQDLDWLNFFDAILVPYVAEADEKKEKFIRIIQAYGQDEILEKVIFLNMKDKESVRKQKEKMQYGNAKG
ncbi:MAG: hypothetical protein Q4D51_00180 [Eubacteriales bacterium]|nr:hypothetical protein [Eubacteriales bacterium]